VSEVREKKSLGPDSGTLAGPKRHLPQWVASPLADYGFVRRRNSRNRREKRLRPGKGSKRRKRTTTNLPRNVEIQGRSRPAIKLQLKNSSCEKTEKSSVKKTK